MTNKNLRKFLRHPVPYPDESISGYLIRLSEANGYCSRDIWSLFGFGKESLKTEQTLAYIYGCADYFVLSRRTGFSDEVLRSLAYQPIQIDSQQFVGTYEMFGHKLASRMLRYKISAMCSGCLTEKPYQRKIWDILSLTACPIHKCMLVEQCPKCSKPIHYRRDRVCFCSCGFDFRTTEISFVSENELRLARRIYELCRLAPPTGLVETNEKMPHVLTHLDLSGLLQSLFLVSSQISNGDIWGKFLSRLTIGERHQTLNFALKTYDDFPNSFFDFLTSLKTVFNHRAKTVNDKQVGKQRIIVYRGIANLLTKAISDGQFDFLRHALHEYLNREKLISYGIALDYTKTTAEEFFNTHLTLPEAAQALNNTKQANKAMMENGTLRAYKGMMPNGQPVCYINLHDIENVKKRLVDIISVVDAARLTGLYIYQMNQLIEAGILEVIEDVKITPIYCRIINKQQVLDFCNSFDKAMRKNSTYRKSSKKLSSKRTFVILGSHQINFGEMAKMVLNGELAPAGRDNKKGINGFTYDDQQIQNLVKEKRKGIIQGTISMDEAKKMLVIKTPAFRNLLRKKYLSFSEEKTILGKRMFIEDITKFCRDFVFSNEIARRFSTSSEYVNRKLADKNIFPVDNELDRYNYLYKRDDIKSIIIEKADPAAWTYKTRREKLRSLPETAHQLGISENELKLAVERKLIYFCRGKYRQEMMFSEKSISAFKKLDLPHVNFLREMEASKMIGIGIKSFRKRFLDEGLITPEVRSYQRKSNNRFYPIEELQKLKADIERNKIEFSCETLL